MTASERLRALGANTVDPFWASEVQQGWLIDMGNALPLIADVVEAAEQADSAFAKNLPPAGTPWMRVRVALTALSEHLEGGDDA